MRSYEDWFKEFISGKTEIPTSGLSDNFSVHTIRRFLEEKNKVWKIAFTFTGSEPGRDFRPPGLSLVQRQVC